MNSHIFEIQPSHRFAGSNAAVRRPKEIAYFSYDDEHNFRLDESSLRYYYPPRLPTDLNGGFESFEKLDDSQDEHLDALLDTIIDLEQRTNAKCEGDVITWRGMMTKSLEVSLNAYDEFIEENNEYKNNQKQVQKGQRMPPGAPSQELMMYWGYKFEALSLIDQPWDKTSRETIESREEKVVNNSSQYCSVVRTGIGNNKLILGGEVDAVWDCKPERKEDPINWVELKTTAEIRSDRDILKYERKLLKFWAQSFLLGVPKIIVGFRDEHGILRRLEEMTTHEIPGSVKRHGRNSWDGNICINFTAQLLDWLRNIISTEGVWRIRKREKAPVIEVFKLEDTGYGGILSDAFMNWRSQK
ncbi:decapping endonuclease targeting mRNA [Ophidiomyces ophidiicola]|nr:decapping endonuclease targeting mRNA [Ophidiomyces ophidiicola]KAI2013688.1 decapping endonuclease targeting mRNA [Ophidiomyces ophidiicola]KAI2130528.1 decapping endonuclease targeting mRNA [Ophidiomyces ophidiicola]KAI2146956.1 decapping endonuclease targeting mRNA [Ophidiomyces ophidiicola]KAI2220529.1 decapping endonuclease targeting mRNA [Ophidiomyces ophidiicola]